MSGQIDFVAAGRSEKVALMVEVLDEVCTLWRLWGCDPHGDAEDIARQLRKFSAEQWLLLQRCTGNKRKDPPSLTTRQMVIEVYEKRVDFAADSEPELLGAVVDRVIEPLEPVPVGLSYVEEDI